MIEQGNLEKTISLLAKYSNHAFGDKDDIITVDEIITLLKAHCPRVMTLEEAKQAKTCWIEDKEAGITYPAIYKCPGNPSKNGKYAVFAIVADSDLLPEEVDTFDDLFLSFEEGRRWLWEADIGKSWRPWSSCPTDEQRKAVKWDE